MFDDNDKENNQPLDFKTLKKSIVESAEPVVETIVGYKPAVGKGKYKPDLEEMPEMMSQFFRAAAELVEENVGSAKVQSATEQVQDAKLDKKAKKLADKSSKLLSSKVDDAKSAISDAKLDKKAGDLADNAGAGLAGFAAAVSDFVGKAGDTVKDAQLDKKAGNLAGAIGDSVKDAHLDKKAGDVIDNLSSRFKEADLGTKAADLAGTIGAAAMPVIAKVKDAELGNKASNAVDLLSAKVKDAELGARASDFADTVSGKVKDAKLGEKASDFADTVSTRVKEAKLDKKLADAKLPEKAIAVAGMVPGIEIKNPKKAAKQFRKKRKEILKAVNTQQKELNKALKKRQIEAAKYAAARQRDIQNGKLRVPKYEAPKLVKKAGFPWGKTLAGTGLAYGGLAVLNTRVWSNVPPLQSKLEGEGHYYRSRQGVIFYKEAGQDQDNQPPVVLVHGIGAGNHSYEWEPNFGAIAAQHKTYAFDLLGFGNSERPALKYTAEVYIKQLTEFLDQVVARPAIVVASSLSSSYAVQVAFRRPQLVQKLILMEPSGIFRGQGISGPNLAGPLSGAAYSVLRAPVLGKAIYSGVASHSGVKSFMENQMFYDKINATPERVEQYWTAAHQEGAEYAPPSFFTGLLNAEIGETLGKIQQPVLIFWGKESMITPPAEREEISMKNPKAQVETIERARLALNQEHPDQFNKIALDFLGKPSEPVTDTAAVGFVHNAGPALEEMGNISTETSPAQTPTQKSNDNGKQASVKPTDNGKRENVSGQAETGLKPTDTGKPENVSVNNPQPIQTAEASSQPEQKGIEFDSSDLKQELEDHRKTFIGDNDTGRALLQDADNDGLDDRAM